MVTVKQVLHDRKDKTVQKKIQKTRGVENERVCIGYPKSSFLTCLTIRQKLPTFILLLPANTPRGQCAQA